MAMISKKRIFVLFLTVRLFRNPYTETVDFLEDTVIQFIIDMTHKAMEIGRPGRVQVTSRDDKEM